MIRTVASCLLLFGILLFVSRAIQESKAQNPISANSDERPVAARTVGRRVQTPALRPGRSATPANPALNPPALNPPALTGPIRTAAAVKPSAEAPLAEAAEPTRSARTEATLDKDLAAPELDLLEPVVGGEPELEAPQSPIAFAPPEVDEGPAFPRSPGSERKARTELEGDELADDPVFELAPPSQATLADRPTVTPVDGVRSASRANLSARDDRSAAAPLPLDGVSDFALEDGLATADGEDLDLGELPDELEEVAGPEVPESLLPLREQVRDVLAYYLERPETVQRRTPWGVMHAFIAYGVDTEVLNQGRPVNAIAYLCWNGPCRGQRLLGLSRSGELVARKGVGVQGHEGQFLAMLAQSKVKIDYPIRVNGRNFTVADLVRHEQDTCREKTELTFKLIGLSHYLDTDATWKNNAGETWDIPRLIKEELAQPIIGAACGGTHRLMGFSYALNRRELEGGEISGQWLRARKYVDSYHDYTFTLQNADGSFSTNWFRGPGALGDDARRLETTGHILEWLVFSLPDDELTSPRTVKSVEFLANLLWEKRDREWEVGPKGHALHALALYDERVFGGRPGQRRIELANRTSNRR